jgi:hypothetical protein
VIVLNISHKERRGGVLVPEKFRKPVIGISAPQGSPRWPRLL